MSKDEVLNKLREGLLGLDEDATEAAAVEAVDKGVDALEAANVLTETIREIGEKFSRFELFLPDLLLATDAMNKALAVLEPELRKGEAEAPSKGTVVIGTVKGDIHDLGKAIVGTMLTASGFKVVDVGKDVPNSAFLEAAEKYNPDIIGASATMTTTIPMQKELVEYLTALGVRDKYKIMVGGAAVSEEHAEDCGADGYATDAADTVKLAERLMKEK